MDGRGLCAKCARGPAGMGGHDDLFCQTMDASQLRFRCRACGYVWVRLYRGAEGVEWGEPTQSYPGVPVPGRRAE